jgi:hypothetical protein
MAKRKEPPAGTRGSRKVKSQVPSRRPAPDGEALVRSVTVKPKARRRKIVNER